MERGREVVYCIDRILRCPSGRSQAMGIIHKYATVSKRSGVVLRPMAEWKRKRKEGEQDFEMK